MTSCGDGTRVTGASTAILSMRHINLVDSGPIVHVDTLGHFGHCRPAAQKGEHELRRTVAADRVPENQGESLEVEKYRRASRRRQYRE